MQVTEVKSIIDIELYGIQKNRYKYLLQYHIIFVCKYRNKPLVSKEISDAVKQLSDETEW